MLMTKSLEAMSSPPHLSFHVADLLGFLRYDAVAGHGQRQPHVQWKAPHVAVGDARPVLRLADHEDPRPHLVADPWLVVDQPLEADVA
jgi:hypothetical protein